VLFLAPRRWTSLLLAAGGGLLADVGAPGLGWWPLTFVAVAALFVALGRDSARWNTLVGFVFGLSFFVPHLSWIDGTVGVVPWLALAAAEAGIVGLGGAGWSWARRSALIRTRAWPQVPVFAILWVGMEELRAVAPFGGFPWGRLAFAHADSPVGRWASIGGVPLVSGLVAAVGVVLALAYLAVRRLDVRFAGGGVLLAVLLVASGWLVPLDTAAQSGRLVVGAVQGNVPNRGLDSFQQAREVLENHVAGTLVLLDTVEPGELDLVLWPENASDIDPREDEDAAAAIDDVARALDAPILVGTDNYPQTGGRLNTALLWDPTEGPVDSYAKQHPAPFAEYVPMRDLARAFSTAVDRVRTDMIPGTEVGVIDLTSDRLGRVVPLGVGICFEVAYDDLIRSSVQAGAEMLVIPTNNANFGISDESTQQLAMSQLRAIEHGRATVQISTVGVSAIISPSGVVQQRTELFTPDQMVASVPLRTDTTLATRFGDAITWAFRFLAGAAVVTGMVGARRSLSEDRRKP
jgi:apolipoprotein N-acyltransferase